MAFVAQPLKKAFEAMSSHDDKISDLQRDLRTAGEESRMTTDYGVRQSNTDDWLKVVSEDKTGPALLEDAFGREKVCLPLLHNCL